MFQACFGLKCMPMLIEYHPGLTWHAFGSSIVPHRCKIPRVAQVGWNRANCMVHKVCYNADKAEHGVLASACSQTPSGGTCGLRAGPNVHNSVSELDLCSRTALQCLGKPPWLLSQLDSTKPCWLNPLPLNMVCIAMPSIMLICCHHTQLLQSLVTLLAVNDCFAFFATSTALAHV